MNLISKAFQKARVFPSIILYFTMRDTVGPQVAAIIAGAYALFYTIYATKAKRETKLDYGMVLFWGAGLAVAVLFPEGAQWYFNDHFTSFLFLLYFLVALLPLLFGAEPFTTAFAKKTTPPEVWKTQQFLTVNKIMTLCWAGLFLSAFVFTLLGSIWFKVIIPLGIMIFIGIPLNKKFPDYYLKKSTNTKMSAEKEKCTPLQPWPEKKYTAKKSSPSQDRDKSRRSIAKDQRPIKKAVILFGSPRGKQGHTYGLLEKFISGMESGGIECEVISLASKTIKPCIGCFSCWTKTPGVCVHKDDMPDVLKKTGSADLVVYAQPLYTFSVPGIMKNFLDRSLPKLEPYLVTRKDNSTRHPLRWRENNPERVVIFSVCGFPEISHFDPMLMMFREMAKTSNAAIVGEILRTASESLLFKDRFKDKHDQLLEYLYEAGLELARQGYVNRKTEMNISRPFFTSIESFRKVANQTWDTFIEYEQKKSRGESVPSRKEFMLNHPGMFFAGMASTYVPEKADGLSGTLQFEITDRKEGDYYFEITPDNCSLRKGKPMQADLTIKTPWDVWLAIADGSLNGQEAYQQGLYKAEGDLSLLINFKDALS